MMPSPSELYYFVEVAHTLNVSRAAKQLGISQPTLSLAIRRLEQDLGAVLLIRSKSGVKLTHAGRKLVGRAQNLIDEWEMVKGEALKDESEIRGRFTLGCHPSVGLFSLPGILGQVLEENSGLEIKVVHDISRRIVEDVINFKIDFGIVINPWPHPDLVIKNLGKDEVTLWTSKKPSPLQNLSSPQAVLICDPDLVQTQAIQKQLQKKGISFGRVITSSSLELVAALAASGAGVGILPGRVATRVGGPNLSPLTKGDWPKILDRICFIYRADAQKSRAAKVFTQKVEEYMTAERSSV